MSMMVSFVLFFFPRGVLGEILNLIGSVSGGFSFLLLCEFCTVNRPGPGVTNLFFTLSIKNYILGLVPCNFTQ